MREPVVQNNVSKFDLGFGLYSNNASVVPHKTVYIHNITATVQYHLVSSSHFSIFVFWEWIYFLISLQLECSRTAESSVLCLMMKHRSDKSHLPNRTRGSKPKTPSPPSCPCSSFFSFLDCYKRNNRDYVLTACWDLFVFGCTTQW